MVRRDRAVAMGMELHLRPFTKKRVSFVCLALAVWMTTGCTVDSAKRHYVLAEKLWTDGKYAASVAEFDKVVAKDPHGKLGAQALLRGATTQALFLSQYSEAVKKLRQYVEASPDTSATWEAQKEIGELLFSKLEQYDQAVKHYQTLIQLNPTAAEVPEFMYRVGRSYFFWINLTMLERPTNSWLRSIRSPRGPKKDSLKLVRHSSPRASKAAGDRVRPRSFIRPWRRFKPLFRSIQAARGSRRRNLESRRVSRSSISLMRRIKPMRLYVENTPRRT